MNDTKPTLILPLKTVRNVLETGPIVCGLMILLISGPDAALVMTAGLLTVGVFSRPETTDRVTGRLLQDHEILFATTLIFFSALIWIPFVAGTNVGMPDWLASRGAFLLHFIGGQLSGLCLSLSSGLLGRHILDDGVRDTPKEEQVEKKSTKTDIPLTPSNIWLKPIVGITQTHCQSRPNKHVKNFDDQSTILNETHFTSNIFSVYKTLDKRNRVLVWVCLYITLFTGYMYFGGQS